MKTHLRGRACRDDYGICLDGLPFSLPRDDYPFSGYLLVCNPRKEAHALSIQPCQQAFARAGIDFYGKSLGPSHHSYLLAPIRQVVSGLAANEFSADDGHLLSYVGLAGEDIEAEHNI